MPGSHPVLGAQIRTGAYMMMMGSGSLQPQLRLGKIVVPSPGLRCSLRTITIKVLRLSLPDHPLLARPSMRLFSPNRQLWYFNTKF